MPKFGASIYSVSREIINGNLTPDDGVRWLADNGAEVIELVPFGFNIANDEEMIKKLDAAAKEKCVLIDNYSINANFLQMSESDYNDELKRVKTHIEAASKLGISTLRSDIADYRRPINNNTIEAFQNEVETIVKAYGELCDYAKQFNMKILIENHGFHINGSDRVRQIIKGVDRENFGHQLDVGNYACVDENCTIAVKKMVEFATVIHLKDFYIRSYDKDPGDTTQFDCSGSWFKSVNGTNLRGSIFAQGDLEVYKIMKLIKDTGFDGNMFIEFEGIEDCYYGTKVGLENAKRIYSEM